MYYFFLLFNQLPLEELGTAILDLSSKIDILNLLQFLLVITNCAVRIGYTYYELKHKK